MKRGTARRSAVVGDRRPLERNLARFLLEERGFAVSAEAATAADVGRAVAEHRPDVLLVHEDVVSELGESIVPGVRSSSPKTRIIVLTSDRLAADAAIVASADAVVEEGPGLKELESALSAHTGRTVSARPAAGPIAFAAAAARPRPGLRERGWVERLQGAAVASIIVLAVVLARGAATGPPNTEPSSAGQGHLVAAQEAFDALVESLPGASTSEVIQLAQTLMQERTAADILGADVATLDAEILQTIGPLLDSLPPAVAQAILTILGDLVTGGSPAPTPPPAPDTEPFGEPEPSPQPGPESTETPSPEPSPSEEPSPVQTETEPPPTETETEPPPTETESPSPSETESPSPTETESPSPSETESPSPTCSEDIGGGAAPAHDCDPPSPPPCDDRDGVANHCDDNELAAGGDHTAAGTLYVVPPGIVLLVMTSGLARRVLGRRNRGR